MGMAAAVPIITTIASVAYGGAQYMQQRESAKAESEMFSQQRYQNEEAARSEVIQGLQVENERRRELSDTLSTINAIRSARGLSLSSPGAQVQRRNIGNIVGDNIRIGNLNSMARNSNFLSSANYYGTAARQTLRNGQIGGFASLLKGAGGIDYEGLGNI